MYLGSSCITEECSENKLQAIVFGRMVLTYGGLMGQHSNEIHLLDMKLKYNKPIVEITTIRASSDKNVDMGVPDEHLQTGDCPPKLTGASLLKISAGKAILSGGLIQPNIDLAPMEIIVSDLNIYQVKSSEGIYELTYNLKDKNISWKKIGELQIPVAYHASAYSSTTNSVIIMGGLCIKNSSVLPGERQSISPVFFSLDSNTVTHRIIQTNGPPLSGMASLQVRDSEIVLVGGFSEQPGTQNENKLSQMLYCLDLSDINNIEMKTKMLRTDGFAQGSISLLEDPTKG